MSDKTERTSTAKILDVLEDHPRYKTLSKKTNPEGYICFSDGFIAGAKWMEEYRQSSPVESKLIERAFLAGRSQQSWESFLNESASQFREPSTEQSDLDSAELRSLKQSILESSLRKYFPQRDMSFHDKVVFAIADATDLGANKMLEIYKGMNDCPLKKHLSQWFDLPEQSGGTEQEEDSTEFVLTNFLLWVEMETTYFEDKDVTPTQVVQAYLNTIHTRKP